ncbi:permease-like cell division protein FtsX [Actinoplanes sp. NPDC020271]|uniref:permease-like cell division protein FtsX n=1 Tax=Actinoplanes sp. NPDC020271 TaxID=3363896 RepID=UPI0037A3D31A
MSDISPEAPQPAEKQQPETSEAAEKQQPEAPTAKERIAAERAEKAAKATPAKQRRGVPVLTALVALAVGAAATFGGLYFTGWRQIPEEKYTMVVILKDGTTQQQKDDIQKVLETLPGHSAVRLVGKAEAFAEAQKAYASKPDALAGLKEDSMPESFRLSAVQRGFDCTALKPLGGNTAISKMSVVKPYSSESNPGADVLC